MTIHANSPEGEKVNTDEPNFDWLPKKCPTCSMNWTMFPPAPIQRVNPAGRGFVLTGQVRCVECKSVFEPPANPMTTEPTQRGSEGELLPCPFCRTADHLSLRSVGSVTADMHARPYQVMCHHLDCEAVSGPVAYGKDAAIAAWNRRPASPVGVSAVTDEMVAAACMANLNPLAEPSSTERRNMRAALQAALSPKGEAPEGWQDTSCDDQFALAKRIAANVGYVLVPEPEIETTNDGGTWVRVPKGKAVMFADVDGPSGSTIAAPPTEGKQP
jgi:hypothetical protein